MQCDKEVQRILSVFLSLQEWEHLLLLSSAIKAVALLVGQSIHHLPDMSGWPVFISVSGCFSVGQK